MRKFQFAKEHMKTEDKLKKRYEELLTMKEVADLDHSTTDFIHKRLNQTLKRFSRGQDGVEHELLNARVKIKGRFYFRRSGVEKWLDSTHPYWTLPTAKQRQRQLKTGEFPSRLKPSRPWVAPEVKPRDPPLTLKQWFATFIDAPPETSEKPKTKK